MNGYVAFSYRVLGRLAEKQTDVLPEIQRSLFRAHVGIRAAAYLSALWMSGALAALGAFLVGVLLGLLLPPEFPAPFRLLVPLLLAGVAWGWVRAIGPLLLRNQASELEKLVDENLPQGLNYMLALASAGLTPRDIWGSLAKAHVFGPLAFEAERIRRDLDLFGHDLLSALRLAQERTPSKRFQEFLQGAISAFQSGVDLENYLKAKGAQYQREAVEQQLKNFDAMGIMAEAFLVAVVAGPLFLIILLTVMTVNQGRAVLPWGFMLVLVFIPLAQLIVGAIIKGMNPKVWT